MQFNDGCLNIKTRPMFGDADVFQKTYESEVIITLAQKTDNRKRSWATLVYPESAPKDWIERLRGLKVPCLVSPLHDKDKWTKEDQEKNPAHVAGMLKKPHYHVELMYSGKKSYEQVKDDCSAFGGVGVEALKSTAGYAAYLTHENEPDKVKYDKSQVQAFGGASYQAIMAQSAEYKNIIIGEMLDWCDKENVYAYCDLMRYARYEKPDWFHVLNHTSTNQMLAFLKSKAWADGKANNQ